MRFLAALTVLATATVNVAVALPGLNNAQASCKTVCLQTEYISESIKHILTRGYSTWTPALT